MLAFMKVLQPKTVEEAYELATKNKTAPMLAGGCWLRLGRRTWPSVIDMASLDLRYVREEDKEFVIGAMATQGDVERFEPLQQFCGGAVVKGVKEILGVQFRNTATMGGSVASKFGFSDIILRYWQCMQTSLPSKAVVCPCKIIWHIENVIFSWRFASLR